MTTEPRDISDLLPETIATIGSDLEHASAEECLAFHAAHKDARERDLCSLARFALASGKGKKARLVGDILRAKWYEHVADCEYGFFPKEARW